MPDTWARARTAGLASTDPTERRLWRLLDRATLAVAWLRGWVAAIHDLVVDVARPFAPLILVAFAWAWQHTDPAGRRLYLLLACALVVLNLGRRP